ncbi:MBL fold metallo-hydrolase [Ralstonia pickettii]|nr:MBL fold metallo-hydrolase [Ralstonia pickettii]
MISFKNANVTVFQSSLVQTNSTVIQTEDMILVVDPAWLPKEVEQLKNEVSGKRNGRPVYLLFTHSHFDHVLGYGAFENSQTIASEGVAANPDKEKVIKKIKDFDDEIYQHRNYEIQYPKIDHLVREDGQKIKIGTTELTFYKSPGHTADGIFTLIDSLGVFIAGDHLSDVEFPFIEDSRDYEETLIKSEWITQNHPVKLLVPGHGQPVEDPEEIHRRQQNDLMYIRELRKSISGGENSRDLDKYINQYQFIDGMKRNHYNNIAVIKDELGIN